MSVAVDETRLPQLHVSAEHECERLFARHAGDVRRYVRTTLRNGSDVDDVVQLTFLKALRALRQGVRPQRPRPWLIAIAHNECRMLFRRNARRPLEVDLEQAAEAVAVDDGATSIEAVRDALEQLAPNQRAVLVLRELEGRTYDEIATALGLTGSAVETLLFRARRALREQLETVGSCDDAHALLAAGELDELSRRRLRAHTRSCRPCATLERRRRGRLAAAGRKLASQLPLPQWLFEGAGGAKVVAVVAAGAVATTGAVAGKSAPTPREPVARARLAPVVLARAATPVVPGARRQVVRAVVPARRVAPQLASVAPRATVAPVAQSPAPVAPTEPTAAAPEPPVATVEPAAPPPETAATAAPPAAAPTVTVPAVSVPTPVDPPPAVDAGAVVPPLETPAVTVTVPTVTLPPVAVPTLTKS